MDWSNPYNRLWYLGNPNFTSAHLGIAALTSLALVLGEMGMGWRLVLTLNVLLSLFVIYQSDSSQGLLVFGLGADYLFTLNS